MLSGLHDLAMARPAKWFTALALLGVVAGCHYEDRRWARVVVASSKSLGVGSCLQEYRQEKGRFPATLTDLKPIARVSRNTRCSREPELLSGSSFEFVSFRFAYAQQGDGSGFLLTAKPLYEGPHQCVFRLDEAFVLEQTCEDSFWGSTTNKTKLVFGEPVEIRE